MIVLLCILCNQDSAGEDHKPVLVAIEILSYSKSFLFFIFCFNWGGEFRRQSSIIIAEALAFRNCLREIIPSLIFL